jgi:diacylglycerol kinase (ATP)
MTFRVLIVFNPHAGQAAQLRSAIDRAAQIWTTARWLVELAPTESAGDATRIARAAAAEGYDLVVAAGGDGTVNEIINGLVGTETAFAPLPAGTVNVWAREMGLPMDVEQAARALLTADRRQIDLGRAKGKDCDRHFLLMASVGFDAAVTQELCPTDKKRLGALAYLKQAAQMAWNYRGSKVYLRIDGQRIRGPLLMTVIGNSQLYGGVVKFTAHALIDDGLLDVCVIQGRSMLGAPLRLLSVLIRAYNRDPKVKYFRAQHVSFIGKKSLSVQLDGDFIGTTPIDFQIVPQAVWAMIPQGADPEIWSHSTSRSTFAAHPAIV